MNSLLLTDGYKTGHHLQYPKGTKLVYSNFTPRSNRHAPKGIEKVISFGQQYVALWLLEHFNTNFFSRPIDEVCGEMKEELTMYLGAEYDVSHFEALHKLGYLPIHIKSLKEGVEVPMRTPVLTIENTLPEFYWITNYLETVISMLLWKPMTSASIALLYKRILLKWAKETDESNIPFVDFQGHDFSMRGMSGLDSVISSGMGHGIVFSGSDSLPAIHGLRKYYDAKGFALGSVNATEHSVMCAGTKDDEIGTFRELMRTFPTGILSIVSDTWDLWKVLTVHLVELKKEILDREGKIVIRPDSGDPVDIICGYEGKIDEWFDESTGYPPQKKGVVELLWDLFGGTTNSQGFKVLDPHIGCIYGDSITPDRAEMICERLSKKGFASTNVVLGIGSFTYQYNTRDTFGFAMKATYVEVLDESREIFKQPVTDDGTKKSAKGLLHVNESLELTDSCTRELENQGELKTIMINGEMTSLVDFETIKTRINEITR